MPSSPINLAVLVSGAGTTLQNLIDAIAASRLSARIAVVIASRPGIKALERAAAAKLMSFVVERQAVGPEKFSDDVFRICDDAGADLVCLGGWLTLLNIPEEYRGRVMNIHPALLPSFGGKGLYGSKVHSAVIEHGCKISGCTVHFVDESYDTGPIILQRACPVLDDDTPDTLATRVSAEEKIAYPEAIRLFHEGRLQIDGRRVRIKGSSAVVVQPEVRM